MIPEGRERRFRPCRWGLIPSWAKDPSIAGRLINAQAETVATKAAFRGAFRQRRCLVLADGFYEWKQGERPRQPLYIRMRDGRPFAFAGLWERWVGPDGLAIDSCILLTITPNDLLRPFHQRIPVILNPRDYDPWLDPGVQSSERLQPLLRPYPSEEMMAYPVTARVNNPSNDTPDCIEPPP